MTDRQLTLVNIPEDPVGPAEEVPFQTVIVHFYNPEARSKFSRLIGQPITSEFTEIWYAEDK